MKTQSPSYSRSSGCSAVKNLCSLCPNTSHATSVARFRHRCEAAASSRAPTRQRSHRASKLRRDDNGRGGRHQTPQGRGDRIPRGEGGADGRAHGQHGSTMHAGYFQLPGRQRPVHGRAHQREGVHAAVAPSQRGVHHPHPCGAQWHSHAHVRVECDRDLITTGTRHLRLEQPFE
eukprot:scaffold28145_cov98-Isochrysis_galbana.AAC.1